MTTATHICNHALTVYKAVFTPINHTDANSASLPCQPAWQEWEEFHFSEGEIGAQRGEKYLPKDMQQILVRMGMGVGSWEVELDFSDLIGPCFFQSSLV